MNFDHQDDEDNLFYDDRHLRSDEQQQYEEDCAEKVRDMKEELK